MMDFAGEWIYDEGVMGHILSGFKQLYTSGLINSPITLPVSNFSYCYFSEEEKEQIGREVLNEEIRASL